MPESILNDQYWTERYQQNETGWDIGRPSPPLKEYIDQLTNKKIKILIPGCGNAYEAVYLWQKGFEDIILLDISEELVNRLQQRFKNTTVTIIHGDFFNHHDQYDLILEQTFFCALHPSQRKDYVAKMYELLRDDGKLTGLLFDREFDRSINDDPPYGGNAKDYEELFSSKFRSVQIQKCYNSVAPRQGTEVFISIKK